MYAPIKIYSKPEQKLTVRVYLEEEPVDVDFIETSEEQDAYLRRFETGELLNVYVVVSKLDITGLVEGTDSIGACHVKANNLDAHIQGIVMEYQMVENATDDLNKKLKLIIQANS